MNILFNLFSSAVLGLVEGLTEFIPVSSSGHLIVARHLLGLEVNGGLAFDAVLQLATILAVLVYFWKDLWGLFMTFVRWVGRRPVPENQTSAGEAASRSQLLAIVVGTIPAVILGFLLESHMEAWFRGVGLVAVAMLAGSALMWFAERVAKKRAERNLSGNSSTVFASDASVPDTKISIKNGLKIGLYQCLALVPGVSRSGATISGGLLSGLDRATATRFSFLLSFPIIAGSGAKKLLELVKAGALAGIGFDLLVASIIAFVVGLAAIHFLIKYLKTHTMSVFIWYRVAFAVVVLFALGLGWGTTTSAKNDIKTYTNSDYGFEFTYPSSASIRSLLDGRQIIVEDANNPNFSFGVTAVNKSDGYYEAPSVSHSAYIYKYDVPTNKFTAKDISKDSRIADIVGKCPPIKTINGIPFYIAFLSGLYTAGGNEDSNYFILTNKDYIIDVDFSDINRNEINPVLASFKLIGDTKVISAKCN